MVTSQRRLLLLVGGVAVVAIAIGLVVAQRTPGYVGTGRRVALEWTCRNSIFWTNDSGTMWWAGSSPRVAANIETRDSVAGDDGLPTKHADGVLRFDTATRATFTSDAGGTVLLTRQKKGTLYELGCLIE